ncbi:MAG: hypothetical protein KTR31_36390 [Myxococcales bacterium]|nr:hypothetical protein [Myxococcales bacterium]
MHRALSWLFTILGVVAVGAAAYVLAWPPSAGAGWLILVVVVGVSLEGLGRTASDDELTCSFCGAHRHQVEKLVAGPSVAICDGCVRLSAEIVEGRVDVSNPDVRQPPGPDRGPFQPPT